MSSLKDVSLKDVVLKDVSLKDVVVPLNHGKLQLEINDELTQKLGKRQLDINVVKINDPNLGKFQPDIRCN